MQPKKKLNYLNRPTRDEQGGFLVIKLSLIYQIPKIPSKKEKRGFASQRKEKNKEEKKFIVNYSLLA
jgi:hypothetical protein